MAGGVAWLEGMVGKVELGTPHRSPQASSQLPKEGLPFFGQRADLDIRRTSTLRWQVAQSRNSEIMAIGEAFEGRSVGCEDWPEPAEPMPLNGGVYHSKSEGKHGTWRQALFRVAGSRQPTRAPSYHGSQSRKHRTRSRPPGCHRSSSSCWCPSTKSTPLRSRRNFPWAGAETPSLGAGALESRLRTVCSSSPGFYAEDLHDIALSDICCFGTCCHHLRHQMGTSRCY